MLCFISAQESSTDPPSVLVWMEWRTWSAPHTPQQTAPQLTHTHTLAFKLGLRLLLLGDAGCMAHPSLKQKYSPTQTPLPHPWQAVAPLHCLKGQDRPLVACLLSVHRTLDNGCLLNEADNWKKEDVVPTACFSHLLSAEPLYFFFLFSFLFHVGLNASFIPSNSLHLNCWPPLNFQHILTHWEVEMYRIFCYRIMVCKSLNEMKYDHI